MAMHIQIVFKRVAILILPESNEGMLVQWTEATSGETNLVIDERCDRTTMQHHPNAK